jgi:hypothetical protein
LTFSLPSFTKCSHYGSVNTNSEHCPKSTYELQESGDDFPKYVARISDVIRRTLQLRQHGAKSIQELALATLAQGRR